MYRTHEINIAVATESDKLYRSIFLVIKIVDVYLNIICIKRDGQLKSKSVAK